MSIFTLRVGNTSPALEYTMSPSDVDLTDATVTFRAVKDDGTVLLDDVTDGVTVEDATDPPVVSYQWQVGDTDVAGRYECEFGVTYDDGSTETFPVRGFIPLLIEART
jgi:hypothetical protein